MRKSEREKTDAGLFLLEKVWLEEYNFGCAAKSFSGVYLIVERGRLGAKFWVATVLYQKFLNKTNAKQQEATALSFPAKKRRK